MRLSLEQLVKLVGVDNAVMLRTMAAEAALAEARQCVARRDMKGAAAGFEAASMNMAELARQLENVSLEAATRPSETRAETAVAP